MANQKNKVNMETIIYYITIATFTLTAIVSIIQLIANGRIHGGDVDYRAGDDPMMLAAQCTLGILGIILPKFIFKRHGIKISNQLYIMYELYVYAAIFLGDGLDFFNLIKPYDIILHTFSGIICGIFGFSIVALAQEKHPDHKISPLFAAVFVACLSITLGVLWELYEFAADGLLGLNLQTFNAENGILLYGRAALMDTMEDLLADTIGSVVCAGIGYYSLKYEKGWIKSAFTRIKLAPPAKKLDSVYEADVK